jgi:hypothetical protein
MNFTVCSSAVPKLWNQGKKEDPINFTPEEPESEKLLQQLVILSCAALVDCVMGISAWNDMLSIFSLATACPT